MRRIELLRATLLAAVLAGCAGGKEPPKQAGGGELARTWLAVRGEARAVDSLAGAGALGAARHHARILYETAALLPALSGAYVSTRQGPLTYALRDMQGVMDSLSLAADRGDSLRVWQQAQKLQRTVAYIGGLYPTGLLPGAVQTPGGAYAPPPEPAPADAPRVELDCPMHPEIRRSVAPDSVGRVVCPKCGMKLVSTTRSSPTGENARPESTRTPAPPATARHMDHHPKHGGQFAMQGDYHLELVTRPDGRIELYVYDAWTRPLSLNGASGELTLEIDEGASGTTEQIIPLRASSATPGLLTALAGDLRRATAATARLSLADTSLALTFPLGATPPPPPAH